MSMFASLRRSALLATSVAIGVATAGGAAHAGFLFSPTNSPSASEQNILFGPKFVDVTALTGLTNATHTPIEFNTISGALDGEAEIGTNGDGQADIVCNVGCGTDSKGGANGAQLTDLEIKLGTGFGATDFIGNLDFGEGTVQIAVTNAMGGVFDYILSNGQNFFTLNATGGDVITDIQITEIAPDPSGNFGWNDLKQPRISGICALSGATCTAIPVPEPASLGIFGAGLVALGWFAMRRKASGPGVWPLRAGAS